MLLDVPKIVGFARCLHYRGIQSQCFYEGNGCNVLANFYWVFQDMWSFATEANYSIHEFVPSKNHS